ncbi:MAG: CHAT domain-containing protein [Saprospiraceae bacterium]|nr:CHAT domain-containing protein [Saprospiraceae bacterium]
MNLKFFFFLFFNLIFFTSIQGQENFCDTSDSLNARSFFIEAQNLYRKGNFKESVSLFKNAKSAYKEIGCVNQVFRMNRNILKVYLTLGDVEAFNSFFNKIVKKNNSDSSTDYAIYHGRILLLKSNMYLSVKQLDSALVYGLKAKKIHETYGAWKYYIRDMNHLALVEYYKQNFEGMERYIDKSFSAYRKYQKDKNKTLQEIMRLYGALYYKTGNYEQALKKTTLGLEIALSDMRSRSDTVFVARSYNNIGLFYIELGDIYKAEDYCNSALYLYKKMGNHFEAATTYLNLGEFFSQQGNLKDALNFYKEGIGSLNKSRNIPKHKLDKSYITMYNGIGDVATQLGRYPEAYNALKKSLYIHKSEESKRDETYYVLGSYFRTIGNYNKAVEYYNKALKILLELHGNYHPKIASIYYDLGQASFKEKNITKASQYYDSAQLAVQFPGNSGKGFIENDSLNVSDKTVLLKVLEAQAHLLLALGKVNEAYNTTLTAVMVLEKMRNGFKEEGSKLFILQKMIPIYELSIRLAHDLYLKTNEVRYIHAAFQLVEKSKAMLLLDALKTEEARHFGNVPKDLLDEERRLVRERGRYEKLLFEAKSSANEKGINRNQKALLNLKRASEKLQSVLEKDYPKYHELKYDTKIASLEQVQNNLNEKTALVEFFIGNEYIYIFSVYKDTIMLTSIPVNDNFEDLIKDLRRSLTDVNLITQNLDSAFLLFAPNARSIYTEYVEPALRLNGIERLIFIPDGLLNYIPFGVLLTSEPNLKKTNFNQLSYLIKQFNINYHYSATLMLFSRESPKTNGQMLAMASSYNNANFINNNELESRHHTIRLSVGDLPGAKKEVAYLSNIFSGKFLYGEQANEAEFKLLTQKEDYSIIHLAMHGIVDKKQPEYSSLVFTYTKNKEDNLLHAYELNLLDINTDLVVLSACETGYGKYERGEGVVSLGRGFMYAGAPSMVMTLWPINDAATSVLISSFYNYLASGFDKDEAMRMAKLSYLKNAMGLAAHPFFWASFINLGDFQHISLYKHWYWWQIGLVTLPFVIILFFIGYRKFR